MSQETQRPVGIVGAGVMGAGIAQCVAQAGHPVVVVDPSRDALDGARRRVADGLRLSRLLRGSRGGTAPAAGTDPAALIRWTTDYGDLDTAWFVVECGPERTDVKERIFEQLDKACPEDTVFATNTSAIPVDRLAARTRRPEQILGMHFMNPAPLKDTVEVVRGPRTGETALRQAERLLEMTGKKGIHVADGPGFVTNRVLMLTCNEAAQVVQEGTADARTVDRIFRDCFGHPMGPLETGDLIGWDVIVDTLHVLREHTGDPKFTPCELLVGMVERGETGRKAGRGFFTHTAAGARGGAR
ncbi:3-hydroxyacyl-CoA dehydrogenase family protein [Streptomyces achromogenes]|uniref:3-hydroxyacyl-CoA dehydrogenase family protein n=1 Tax=Streptomyces achromogenes TaxID=67255 RepID=A0ABZ1KEM3_STRAH